MTSDYINSRWQWQDRLDDFFRGVQICEARAMCGDIALRRLLVQSVGLAFSELRATKIGQNLDYIYACFL